MQRKQAKKLIYKSLDNNVMLARFGLVNLAVLRGNVDGLEIYSDDQLKEIVNETFEHEMVNGVEFINK